MGDKSDNSDEVKMEAIDEKADAEPGEGHVQRLPRQVTTPNRGAHSGIHPSPLPCLAFVKEENPVDLELAKVKRNATLLNPPRPRGKRTGQILQMRTRADEPINQLPDKPEDLECVPDDLAVDPGFPESPPEMDLTLMSPPPPSPCPDEDTFSWTSLTSNGNHEQKEVPDPLTLESPDPLTLESPDPRTLESPTYFEPMNLERSFYFPSSPDLFGGCSETEDVALPKDFERNKNEQKVLKQRNPTLGESQGVSLEDNSDDSLEYVRHDDHGAGGSQEEVDVVKDGNCLEEDLALKLFFDDS